MSFYGNGVYHSRKHFAATNFTADADAIIAWSNSCLTTNTNYFRARRELFEQFTRALAVVPGNARVTISSEQFIVVRSFLTAKNDSINDDKRLAFDKAVVELRAASLALA